MTERHDGSTWEQEVAATQEQEKLGHGVGVDEPASDEPATDETASGSSAVEGESPVDGTGEAVAAAAEESDTSAPEEGEDATGAEDAAADAGQDVSSEAPKLAEYDETFVTLEPGQIVQGKVVQVGSDEVMVDVGYKSEGRIPLHELGLKAGQTPDDAVKVGDEIDVYVLKVEDAEGNVLLSKRRADSRVAWERLERAMQNGEIIEAPVTERVKGGLLVDVGVRGFIPASHVARSYVENLDEYVGQTLGLKVIELDRQRNNVVLSRKEVLEEEYERAKAEAFAKLEEGAIVDGVVRRITDFGAFVDVGGGVEGLLHVSEMAWSRVRHPSDVVKEDQQVKVMVLKVDRENERISLSLKEALPDPWQSAGEKYIVGSTVTGTVTRVVDFGAFVKLEDGIEGLVHISQLADYHVTDPNEVVKPGDEVEVRVVSVDVDRRRIGLSMRQPQPSQPRRRERGGQRQETRTTVGDAPTVTLGDVFEDLGSLFSDRDDE